MLRNLLLAIAGVAVVGATGAAAQEAECLAYRVTIDDFARDGIAVEAGLASVVAVLERRVSDFGPPAPTATVLGNDIVVVRLPPGSDLAGLGEALARPGAFSIHLVERTFPTSDLLVMLIGPDRLAFTSAGQRETSYLLHASAIVDRPALSQADAGRDQYTGEPTVTFVLKGAGRAAFAAATKANVNVQAALVVDDVVLSAPVIREPISDGTVQIGGGFTPQSANELAMLLRSGALPARLALQGEGPAACIP